MVAIYSLFSRSSFFPMLYANSILVFETSKGYQPKLLAYGKEGSPCVNQRHFHFVLQLNGSVYLTREGVIYDNNYKLG